MPESRAPGDRRAPGGRRGNTSSVVTSCHPACPREALCPTSSAWAGDKSPGEGAKAAETPRGEMGESRVGRRQLATARAIRTKPGLSARMGNVCLQPWLRAGVPGVPAGPRLLLPHREGHGYCKEGLKCIPAPQHPPPCTLSPALARGDRARHLPTAPRTPESHRAPAPGEGDSI